MVADNWMKRNPFISMLITAALTVMCSFVIVKAEWARSDKKEMNEAISKKADITYVDKEINELEFKKADKSLVESMDHKLDLILRKLK